MISTSVFLNYENITNKSAIVTGASGGIGRVVAKRLASDGFAIAVHYAGNPAKAEAVVTEIKGAGGKAIAVQADVAKPADVETLFQADARSLWHDRCGRAHGGNYAPASNLRRRCRNFRQSNRDQFARNFSGAGTSGDSTFPQAGASSLSPAASLLKSFPNYGPYIASKAGVEGLVRVLANELRGRNITVNTVAPGPIPTELFLKGKTEAQIEQFKKLPPLERLGQAEDIAGVVSFLAGP